MTFQPENAERLPEPINAALFDLAGVVFDVDSARWYATRASELRVPLEAFTLAVKVILPPLQVGGIAEEMAYAVLCSALNLAEAPMPVTFWQLPLVPNTPMVDLVRQLKRDYRVAFLTNAYPSLLLQMHTGLNALDLHNEVYASCEMGIMKGSGRPGIYWDVLQLLGANPNSTVFVDDTESHVVEAERLGFRVIHFDRDMNALYDSLRALGVEI